MSLLSVFRLGKSGPPLRAAGPRPFQYNFRSAVCPFEHILILIPRPNEMRLGLIRAEPRDVL